MVSVASQLIEEVTEHAQSDSLEDAREICVDGTYFPNNLRTFVRDSTASVILPSTGSEISRTRPDRPCAPPPFPSPYTVGAASLSAS